MGILGGRVQREVHVVNLGPVVGVARIALLGWLVRRVVLVKGQGADLVLRARMLDQRVLADRGKRGVPTLGRPEALPRARPLIQTGSPLTVQKVVHVGHERRQVQAVVRARPPVVQEVRHAVVDPASQVVGALRRVPATPAQIAR